jgi:hypothetical protein
MLVEQALNVRTPVAIQSVETQSKHRSLFDQTRLRQWRARPSRAVSNETPLLLEEGGVRSLEGLRA